MVQDIKALKSAIIGKAWKNQEEQGIIPASYTLPTEMTFRANESYLIGSLTFRTDRNSKIPVTVKAGEKLFFYANPKRPGVNPATGVAFEDPDYSVSVLMPTAEAEAFIADSLAGSDAWKKEHAAA